MPKCNKCFKDKIFSDFYFRSDTQKYRLACKECFRKTNEEYRKRNVDFIKKIKIRWQRANPDKRRVYNRRYLIKNRKKINNYNRFYKRYKQSFNARLIANYRTRIWKAIKQNKKSETTEKLLGCSIEELKKHLENTFQEGMTWDNWGFRGWHIDHKIPCAKFNLRLKSEQKKCFNFNNLQSLWAHQNHIKSCK